MEDGEPSKDEVEVEVVTTVHVLSVPADVTEREFNGWFLFAAEFEDARISDRGGMGWARFSTEEGALAAVEWLNGRPLSEKCAAAGSVLKAQMAKNNFRPGSQAKRQRVEWSAPVHAPSAWAGQKGAPPPPAHAPPAWAQAWADDGDGGGSGAEYGTVSTLFLWGMTPGVTEQEVTDWCQECFSGLERVHVAKKGTVFVKFLTPGHAHEALAQMANNFMAFSSSPDTRVTAELAKNDLFNRDQASTATGNTIRPIAAGKGRAIVPPNSFVAAGGWGQGAAIGQGFGHAPKIVPAKRSAPEAWEAPRGVVKCDTMFIGGLSPITPEEEVMAVLEAMDGFQQLKISPGRGKPMAWARFDDGEKCGLAIEALQGNAFPSAPESAVNCQFAKHSLDAFERHA